MDQRNGRLQIGVQVVGDGAVLLHVAHLAALDVVGHLLDVLDRLGGRVVLGGLDAGPHAGVLALSDAQPNRVRVPGVLVPRLVVPVEAAVVVGGVVAAHGVGPAGVVAVPGLPLRVQVVARVVAGRLRDVALEPVFLREITFVNGPGNRGLTGWCGGAPFSTT